MEGSVSCRIRMLLSVHESVKLRAVDASVLGRAGTGISLSCTNFYFHHLLRWKPIEMMNLRSDDEDHDHFCRLLALILCLLRLHEPSLL